MLDDIGRLLSRVALGASIAAHGAQKEWGTFNGPGPQGAAGFLESLGFVPGARYATAAARTEIASGILIALGVGGPIGPAALVSTMVVAQASVHIKNGYFAQNGGIELGVMYSTAAVAIASAGYGRFSLDDAFGWKTLREPSLRALAFAGGIAAALVILAQRSPMAGAAGSDSGPAPTASHDPAPGGAIATGSSPNNEALATTQEHIAAAAQDRPVPADLLSATDETVGL